MKKILYITGSCLRCNTSANMSHNSYLQGFLQNGCEVDVIMSNEGTLQIDEDMPLFKNAQYYIFNSISKLDTLKVKVKKLIDTNHSNIREPQKKLEQLTKVRKKTIRGYLRSFFKKVYNCLANPESPYHLYKEWIKNASKFFSNINYDLVISNSSPASSHEVAYRLIKKQNVKCNKWIQIWEDPWYCDLYMRTKNKEIYKEEAKLLNQADKIYYVSPITLIYQKEMFKNCSRKMKCIPLPYLQFDYKNISVSSNENCVFGYFGDYFSYVRNIIPFYEALKEVDATARIYGDTDVVLESSPEIVIKDRVLMSELKKIQQETDVLIMLCNLKGGQIPGKIYHYSSTNKPIIFILDGNEDEKNEIYNYFKRFNRYYFCNNNKKEIIKILSKFISGEFPKQSFCIDEFSPVNVAKLLIS